MGLLKCQFFKIRSFSLKASRAFRIQHTKKEQGVYRIVVFNCLSCVAKTRELPALLFHQKHENNFPDQTYCIYVVFLILRVFSVQTFNCFHRKCLLDTTILTSLINTFFICTQMFPIQFLRCFDSKTSDYNRQVDVQGTLFFRIRLPYPFLGVNYGSRLGGVQTFV